MSNDDALLIDASKAVRIYVANTCGPADAYFISEARVRARLNAADQGAHIDICQAADPDLASLSRATHVIGYGFDTRLVRSHAPQLRAVHSTSAGVERYLPLDWLPNGAVLTNSSGVHAAKGGAYGAMAILMLNELIPRHATHQRAALWDRCLSTPIEGKTVVIYGFGALGSGVARRIRGFGVTVIGVRRSGEPHPDADEMGKPENLPAILSRANFLVLACPLTAETRGLIGAPELAALPRGAGLLNIARGPVVDTVALMAALASGHLSGAILDVFDAEPLAPSSPLWGAPNLMITPHTSCDDADGDLDRGIAIFARNIAKERLGLPLDNVIDAVLGY